MGLDRGFLRFPNRKMTSRSKGKLRVQDRLV